jgi:subtilisin family serine protease
MSSDLADCRPHRRVRIAVIDSGVHADHPHIGSVAGGIAIDRQGHMSGDYVDRIGHGTAVMAAIKEKAPGADCYAVRIFDTRLTATAQMLIGAIDWAVLAGVDLINLSLGTCNTAHVAAFEAAVARACAANVAIVAARDDDGVLWLPGSLPGVVQVQVDWECPRNELRVTSLESGSAVFRASGFARPIPGVDPRRNLHGISFAVANVSGFLARVFEQPGGWQQNPVEALLAAHAMTPVRTGDQATIVRVPVRASVPLHEFDTRTRHNER